MSLNDGLQDCQKNDKPKLEKTSENSIRWTNDDDERLVEILEDQTEHPVRIVHHIKQIKDLFTTVHSRSQSRYFRPSIESILYEAYVTFNITKEDVQGISRSKLLLQARGWICGTLYMAGYTFAEISRAINKHQSTIKYTLEREGYIQAEK